MAIGHGLPPDDSPGYADDWKTGQSVKDPVFREGKWWHPTHWAHHQMAVRDRQRIRNSNVFRNWLSGQQTDPGL